METSFDKSGRCVTSTFDMGVNEDGDKIEVEVHSSHNKEWKRYGTNVLRMTIKDRGGYKVRSMDLMGDSMSINAQPVARYSAGQLQAFHQESMDRLQLMLKAGDNEKLERLFMPGKEPALV